MVMRTAILHIGMHKTGSSSIQQTLAAQDWTEHLYVREGSPNHSVMLRTVFQDNLRKLKNLEADASWKNLPEIREKLRKSLETELGQVTKPNIILSGEDLSGRNTVGRSGIEALRDLLMQHVDRIQVIGFVRSPASLIQSVFQQRAKVHSSSHNRAVLELHKIPYRARLEQFDTIFGRENVTLVKFDRKTLTGGDVVLDFTDWIGLVLTPEDVVQANVSLSQEAVAALYARNKYGVGPLQIQPWHRVRQTARRAMDGFGSGAVRLSATLLQPVLEEMAADIDWLEARMGEPMRDTPHEGADCIGSEADLLALAADQKDAIRSLLLAELGKQKEAPKSVAEMLDLLQFLAMSRQTPGTRQEQRKQRRAAKGAGA
jgi:hypothetical protein